MTRLMSKRDVQATLKHIKAMGYTVEGSKGSYKVMDDDIVIFKAMPHSSSNGPSLVTLNDEYFG